MEWKKYLRLTLEWRVIATVTDFSVIYLWTGQIKQATTIAIVLVIIKSTFFYFWRSYVNRKGRPEAASMLHFHIGAVRFFEF